MKKLLCCLADALALALCAAAQAGTVSGDAYVGERFGRLEIAPPAGRWAITDRESAGTSDEGGPVADLQLTAPVGDIRPLVRVTGVKKVDAAVTADFVLKTSRDALQQQGGEAGPVQRIQVGARSVWSYEARLDAEGQPLRTRLVVIEGAQAFFLLQMVVPAAAFDEAGRAFDQLLPAVKY